MLNKPPQIAAKAMHIMMSCENFISERFESEIKSPGARTTIGSSVGAESVKIASVGTGMLDCANKPWFDTFILRGAERLGAAITIKSTIL